MKQSLLEAFKHRRSYYSLSSASPVSDQEIENLIGEVVKCMPSANNSQSARLVLLLGKEHAALWDIVKSTLKARVNAEQFVKTENKINKSFASGHGTILFFEDQDAVKDLQTKFPSYAETYPIWSEHTSAMHQIALWTLLEDMGFGASLQHYNPIIDDQVKAKWQLPQSWKLIAQMPFGIPVEEPSAKTAKPLEERFLVFK